MAGKGLAVGCMAVGGIFLWSAIMNQKVTTTIQSLIAGKKPQEGPAQSSGFVPSTGTGTGSPGGKNPPPPAPSGSLQAYAQKLLAQHGWSNQFASFNSVEMAEAGWNPHAENGSSGAYGLAQSLGHPFPGGPASNGINEYGGNGLSATESRQASEGDGFLQLVWMMNYIASRYGSPNAAWVHEQNFHWY